MPPASCSPSIGLSSGIVNHFSIFSHKFGSLYLSETLSDITLIVDSHRLPAHKIILAATSDYFRALLFGGLKESLQTDIEIKVSSVEAFKHLLKYLYCGRIELKGFKDDILLDLFGLSHEYGLVDLEKSIIGYMKHFLTIDNVISVYETTKLNHFKQLSDECLTFIDSHAMDFIANKSFFDLSESTLKEIISRDTFFAPEVDIFRAVGEWIKTYNQSQDTNHTKDIISCIRWPLISSKDLVTVVRSSGLLEPNAICDEIRAKKESRNSELKHRACLLPEENVATAKLKSKVIHGTHPEYLLDGNYDGNRGQTYHSIVETPLRGIVICLGKQYVLNQIRLLLWDKDNRKYSYYIEISVDMKDWVRIIDRTREHYNCWQTHDFDSRVVKYIRLIGTYNTYRYGSSFNVVSFECMFTNKNFEVKEGSE